MLIKRKPNDAIAESEVTSQSLYLSRRQFMAGLSTLGAGTLIVGCRPPRPTPAVEEGGISPKAAQSADELGDPLNQYDQINSYNNYYEFTTTKEDVKNVARNFISTPWQVEVGGLVKNPGTYGIDKLRTHFDQEERIYRLRCVEAWSMVIPWNGFPLAKLLREVEPTAQAKYVAFTTLYDPKQMPGQKSPFYTWPYTEGLRLDEAMHDLTLLATGIYGESLLPQNGAPIRLVVPWKYGFKSIKSIVKIDLVETQPSTLWNNAASNEYGFYSNVNPNVNHPRWSQGSERRIGENGRRPTLMFNGYEKQVASLYQGMDLKVNF